MHSLRLLTSLMANFHDERKNDHFFHFILIRFFKIKNNKKSQKQQTPF